jgi:acyl-CoA synthetase (AMP-forming)/AMP-acid ligase II
MTDTSAASSGDLLLDRFAKNVAKQPSKAIFSFIAPGLDGGRIQKSFTYDELAKETSALAQRLLEAGLKKGDR